MTFKSTEFTVHFKSWLAESVIKAWCSCPEGVIQTVPCLVMPVGNKHQSHGADAASVP